MNFPAKTNLQRAPSKEKGKRGSRERRQRENSKKVGSDKESQNQSTESTWFAEGNKTNTPKLSELSVKFLVSFTEPAPGCSEALGIKGRDEYC